MRHLPRRRRLEAKTDYKARLTLLSAGKPRLVLRRSNRYIIAQLVKTNGAQDTVIATATSKELLNNGWPNERAGSLKSKPAAYLTGLLLAVKVKGKVKEAILDLGMYRNVHKSRLYAALKGALDGGLSIPSREEVFPSHEILEGNKEIHMLSAKIKQVLQ